MSVFHWLLLAGFAVFAVVSADLLRKAVSAWRGYDPTAAKGKPGSGALYSLTGAMLPWKKESARLYPASYVLGVLYHAGSFLSFFWLVVLFFGVGMPPLLVSASVVFISATALCGLALLVKRIANPDLRYFSSPDDYFSNVLVTGWQVLVATALLFDNLTPALLVWSCALFLYIPVGKLRHVVYFIPARVYLGIFYGRRGAWPVKKRQSWRA